MTRGKPNPKHLGLAARLKKARKAAGLTGSALSRSAGLSHPAARNIEENGAVPRIDVVDRLAAVLKVSPCYLAFGVQRDAGATDTSGVGARLKEARERAGVARSALGRQSGISGQNVSNIEDKGIMPGVDTAEQLAKALDISPCWLAFGEPEAEPRKSAAKETPARAKIRRLAANLKGTALTAADLEPLVDRLAAEELAKLADHTRACQEGMDRASVHKRPGPARARRDPRSTKHPDHR